MINGFDSMVVTKLDVLDPPRRDSGMRASIAVWLPALDGMPATAREIATIEPVYERPPRLERADRGHFRNSKISRESPPISGLFLESKNRCRSRLHLDRTGAHPDHHPPRFAARKS
jgi:hypothetical protein